MTIKEAAKKLTTFLINSHKNLSCSESCTGGWAAKAITDIPGVSACFVGAVVAYSNFAKSSFLSVPETTIQQYGAVSEETAAAMAIGSAMAFGSNYAFSITGIAGPDGGSKEKPVGTVCFGFYGQDKVISKMQIFRGNRNSIRKQAVLYALNGMLAFCQSAMGQVF